MQKRTALALLSICSQLLTSIPFGDIAAGLPEREPWSIPVAKAQVATQWVGGWNRTCESICGDIGETVQPDSNGNVCASGERTEIDAFNALGAGIFLAGCWPYACPNNLTNFPNNITVGNYCYVPNQKRDNDATDITAACSCSVTASTTQCSDGVDNDGDGATDFPNDFGCSSTTDDDESNPKAQCQDGIDNDGDGLVDFPQDPGCSSRQDNDEFNSAQCNDGIDNDGDGAADFPNDFSCSSTTDNDETLPRAACQDSIDNDGDGLVDFPQDPGCSSRQDNDEFNSVQCNDGVDNDGDGATDFPADFSCSSSTDNDETLPRTQCQDSIDNDGDGLIDFPQDPGCTSRQDNTELNVVQCNDGIDNDGDGAADFPNDFSCSSATDNDETNPKAQCQDSIDNDGDGLVDFPQDPGCSSRQDNDESNSVQCNDGIDNDGDGATDFPNDFSCSTATDNDETNPKSQCQDSIDNDGDGLTDFPNDPGCSSRQDNDESNSVQCNDGVDNDGDGATDFPSDFSCSSATDNDETLPRAACQDGVDNDGDGLADFPQDPGCTSRQDNNEFNAVAAPACSDGIDNDGDNLIDFPQDPGCSSSSDTTENNTTVCGGTSTVSLGTSFLHTPTDDSQTDQFGNSVTRQAGGTFNCPAGQVITRVAYLGIEAGNDSTDGLTIACSPLNSNGTLGARGADFSNSDFNGNSRFPSDLVLTTCNSSNAAVATVYFNDILNAGREDALDGTGIGCNEISSSGISSVETDTQQPNDIVHHGTPVRSTSCPTGTVAVGIIYDSFGSTLPADPDAMDSVVRLRCAPIATTCTNVQCSDGIDNDGDGATDFPNDFSCSSATDNDETLPRAQCQDSIDNDGDGLIDFPQDPGCTSRQDNSELNVVQCNDGVDNDGDGATDFPNDFSCSSATDDDETLPRSQCQDSVDNDGDGLVDFPQDPGCTSRQDNSELNVVQCNDGIDNDGDGATDFPNDFSCSDANDIDEVNPKAQCQDGIDNDGDGKIDFVGSCPVGCTAQTIYDSAMGNPVKGTEKQFTVPCDGTITINFYDDNAYVRVRRVEDGVQQMLAACDNEAYGYCGTGEDEGRCCATSIPQHGAIMCTRDNALTARLFAGQGLGCPGGQMDNLPATVRQGDLLYMFNANFAAGHGLITFAPQETSPNGTCQSNSDTDCSSNQDNTEAGATQCNDGIDNDGDGATDFPNDFSCSSATDNDETNPKSQCQDSIDNDGDGLVDFPQDPGCTSRQDNSELNVVQCNDGIDNDGDGATDFPNDFSCSSATDNDETLPRAACQDSIDNDGDGLFDFPQDPGCTSRQDNNESNSVQCNDGIDNDGDGATDFPNDFGCSSPTDIDEANPKAACQDGIDNDGDGLVDFPQDPGCTSRQDNDEFNQIQADLSITKTGPSSTTRGSVVSYTVTATNAGPNTATNVTIADPIPAGLTFNSGGSTAGCVQNGGNILCNNITLTSGQSVTRTIAFTVSSTFACSGTIQNQAAVSTSATDPNPANNQSGVVSTMVTCAQCSDGADNDGDGATDFPNDFSCSSATDNDETNPKAQCQDGIDNDSDGLVDFPNDPGCLSRQDNSELNVVQCNDGVDNDGDGATDFPNDFSCSSATDNDETNPKAACQDGVDNDGDGLTDFPQDPGCVSRQDNDEFNSVQCNDGVDNDGDGATDYPNDFSCSSATDNDETLPRSQCQDSIDNDGDGLVDFPQDPGCTSRQDNDEFNQIQADLSVTKTGPSSVARGAVITYTLTGTNAGPNTATNVTIADPIPAGLTFTTVGSSSSCVQNGSNILCNNITLSSGQSVTRTIAFTVSSTFNCGGTIQNQASISTSATDPNPANNQSAVVSTTVTCVQCSDGADNDGDGATDFPNDFSCSSATDNDETLPRAACQDSVDNDGDGLVDFPQDPGCLSRQDNNEFNQPNADLSIVKSGVNSIQRGSTLVYTLTATNLGPDTATNVTMADPIPAGLTFNAGASDASCVQNGGSILCNNITLTAGQSVTRTIAFNVPSTFACNGTVQNQASVSTSATDPNPSNNQSSIVSTTVTCPLAQCQDGVDNDGDGAIDFPNDFSCYSATDNDETLPRAQCQDSIDNDGDGLLDFPQDPGCSSNQDNSEFNTVQCNDGVDNDGDGATDFPNDFSCSSATDNDETLPRAQCQDSIDNDGDGLFDFPQDPGCTSRQDNDEFNSVQCNDGIDNDGDGATDFPNDFSCSSATNNDETLPRAQCQDSIDNDGDGLVDFPQDPGCTSRQDNDEFNSIQADLSITKSGPSSTTRGSVVSYTVTVTNAGPNTATNVTIADPIPSGLSFQSAGSSSGCVQNGSNILCNNITLTSGQSVTRTMNFNVPSSVGCGTTIQNQASVSTSATDPNPSNNQSGVVSTTVTCAQCSDGADNDGDGVTDFPADFSCSSASDNDETLPRAQCQDSIDNDGDGFIDFPQDPGCTSNQDNNEFNQPNADLSIVKSGVSSIQRGSTLLYTLTATNFGPDTASNVTIADPIPAGLTFNAGASDVGCIQNGGSILCNSITLTAGQSATRTIAFNVPGTYACNGTVNNQASVSTSATDNNPSNNQSAVVTTTVTCPATDLTVSVSAPSSVQRGGTLSYTVSVTNISSTPAQNVQVIDPPVPAGFTTFNAGASSPSCSFNGTNVVCNAGTVNAGQTMQFTIVFNVSATTPCGTVLSNTVNVATSSPETNTGDNSFTVSTTISCPQCSDSIDNDSDGATDFPADFSCSSAGDNDETLPRAACQDSIDNDSDGFTDFPQDPGCTSNQDNNEFNQPNADLSIVKSGVSSIQRGSTLLYTLTVTNFGPDTASSVTMTDPIPAGLTFNSGASDASCVQNGGSILCNNITLTAGQSVTRTIAFNVPANFACNGTVNNQASVSTSATDPNPGNNQSTVVSTTVTCPLAQCQDGVDNDGDGAIDFPADFSCSSATDNDETLPRAQCQDSVDNDADGLIDFPQDPGCLSAQDNNEFTAPNADLSIVKSGVNSIQRGSTLLYTLTATNFGPDTATNVTMADPIPAGLTFNSGASDASCVQNGGSILCNNITLTAGQSVTRTIAFNVPSTFTCNGTIQNQASVSTSATDPNPGNNQSAVISTTVTCPLAQCQDGIDNDNDGATDYPNDFSCSSATDNDETLPRAQCQDSIDNDGDGLVDFPQDPGCSSNQDNSEVNTVQCNDGIDNDGDGATDFPNDFSCSSATDNDETLPRAQCQDSIDNDGDGLTDFPQDPGCSNRQDNNEFNTVSSPACSDGIDNDGDGLIDFPQDPGCSSSNDTTESDFCTGTSTVSLGTSFLTAPTDDSQTDQFGNSVTRQAGGTFTCPAGQVITRVAYLGIEAGNDSTDGLTIACSPLNSNGTLGARGANFSNSDLSSNPRFPSDLLNTTCNTTNAAVTTVYFNDIINSGREDALDGTGIGCNLISSTGISSTETDTQQPNDIVHHGTPIDSTSCPTGTVAVGITYDSFGSTLPADPDAMDSVVRLRCAPVVTSCTNTQCSDGIDNDGDGATDYPNDFSCSSATDNDETLPRAQCQDSVDNDGDGFVDFPQDPGCSSNQDNDEFNQVQADLSISKSGPSSVQRGSIVTYTLTATNAGPNTATNVAMADPIPAGLTFNAGGSSANCTQNGGSVLCNTITLTAGQSVSRTVSFTVSASFTCNGTIQNQASVSTSATDSNPGNNQSAVVSTTVTCPIFQCSDGIDNDGDGATDYPNDFSCSSATDNDETLPRAACQDFIDNDGDGLIDFPQDPGCSSNQDNDEFNQAQADLRISKTGPATAARGGIITYTLVGTNAGPNTATNVTFADPIPAGLTFNTGGSSGNCTQNGSSILCSNLTLTNGQSVTVTIAFNVPSTIACGSVINNGASISTSTTDPNPGNNQSAVVQTTVTCVQCSDGFDNDGDGAIDFPADFSCSDANDNDETLPRAQCQDSVDNDGDGLIDFPQDPGCISNQDNDEFNQTNADLSISKTGPATASRGGIVSYNLTGTNAGPNTATNVTMADPIPAGLTFNAAGSSSNCVVNGSNVLCNNITLGNGQSATVTVAFTVPSTIACGTVIQNGASISTSTTDPNPANNQSNVVSTTVTCVQCSDGVDNDGDGATDFPADFSCSNANDNDETLPRAQCQDSIDNDGDGLIDFPQDPGCLSNQDNDEFNAILADLSLTKTGPSSVARGSTVTYTLVATNAGPNTATNVTIADPIPSGLTFNSAGSSMNCVQNGANILCNNITLTNGQSATILVSFNVPSAFTCNGTIQNQGSVSTSATDPNPSNNQSGVVSTTVTCVQCSDGIDNDGDGATDFPADFSCSSATDNDETLPRAQCQDSIDNDADGLIDFPQDPGCLSNQDNDETNAILADLSISKTGPSSVVRGNTVTYTLTGTNAGPNTATNVTMIDPIPAGLTFNAAGSSSNCIQNGANILCNNITLTSGQTATATVAFTVPSAFTCNGVIQNQASINTSATDPNPANNQSAVVATTVTCPPVTFTLSKTDGKTQTIPGDTLNYVISVTNTSVTNATNVTVTDTLPSNVTHVSSSGGTLAGNVVTFVIPAINAGQTITRTVSVTVNAGTANGTVLTNTANVTGAQAQDTTTVFVAVTNADLSIVKSGVNSIQRGSTLLYTLTATNAGPATATNVNIIDPIPSGLTFNAAQSDASCIQNGANILCNNLTLTSGQSATRIIAFNVPSTFTCNGTIQNQASVNTSATDPNPANNQSAVISTTVTCPPATFSITKTDGRTTAAPADTLTYTITVQNTSAVNATNVTVTDTLPGNVTFVSASGGTLAGNVVTFVIPTLNAGQTVQRTVIATVNAGTANGTVLTNTASVSGNSATDTTTVAVVVQQADLSITKTGASTIQRGSTILYTLVAQNAGPNTATNVTIADPIPAGLTFNAAQSSVSCIQNSANILCNNLTLTSGQSATVTIAFTVPSTFTCNGVIQNQASVSTSATDPNSANNQSAVVSTTVTCPPATFTISKTDNRVTALPGDTLNYAIIVTNTSVTNATNVTVTDTLPSNVTHVSSSGGTLAGNVVTFVIPAINAGQSATRTVTVTVNAGTASGTVLSNTAAVGSTTATDTTTVGTVAQQADLSITKTGASSVQRGSTIVYTLVAQNAGPNTATNVTIADAVPSGLTFFAAQSDASCILNGANILCNNFNLTSGQSKTVLIAFTVSSTFTCNGTIQNQASVSTSITDPNSANNQSAVVSTTVTCPPATTFTISKTDSKTTAAPGETLTYAIVVTNTSATAATGVIVTDTLPGNITFVSASGGTLAGNVVTFTIPSMGSGQTITRTVVITANAGLTNGTVLTNTANVGTFQAVDTTTIQTGSTFSITKTDNKTTAAPGETLTYVITVRNTSGTAATNVSVTDTLPSNVTFLSATGSIRNGNTVTWSGISLAAGQSVTLPLQVQINSGVANGTVISNTASIGTVTAQDSTTVQTSGTATLTLNLSDSQDPVAPGQTFNYTVVLTNATSVQATGVNLQQVLDGDSEFLSATNNGTHSNGLVTWTNLTVPANGSLTLSTTVRAKSTTEDGDILNSTAFSSSLSDSETTLIRDNGTANRDITITVRDSVDPVEPTECFDYIISVRNNRSTSEVVDVTGFLDDDTEFEDADRNGRLIGNNRVEWQDISISANSTQTLHVTVCVHPDVFDGRSLQFRARAENAEDTENTRVVSGNFLPPPILPPVGGAIITVDKSADRQEAQPGSVILYTVTIRNAGGTPVPDMIVEDTISAGNVTVEETGGGVITGNGITWTGISLAANSTRVLQYRLRVSPSMQNGQIVSNSVTVRSPAGVATDSEQVHILTGLPQTGGSSYLSANLNQHLRPRVAHESDAGIPLTSLPMLIWTQILAIGLGAGSLFGKKMLIGI